MAMVGWDSLRDLVSLQDRMTRLFEDSLARTRVGRTPGTDGKGSGVWMPLVDIYETDEAIVMRAELPGVDKRDVQIEIHDGVLTLRGERRFTGDVQKESHPRIERAYGTFVRSFDLPNTVRLDGVTARFADGVLEVTLPKSEAARSRRIAVEVA